MATKPKTTKPKAASKPQQKAKDDSILVVIPWLKSAAQGRELEYAVAGWRRHFKEKHRIIVTGADDPQIEGVEWVESPRVPEIFGMYRQHLDYVSCFRKVRKAYPDSKGFIFVADDVYAVNDFDIIDVKLLKAAPGLIHGDLGSPNGWEVDKARTRLLLEKEGWPRIDYTTHLPQWFEWDKLEMLWDQFKMDEKSYVFEDLYYNIYFSDRIPFRLNLEHDNFKCGVYRANPRLDVIKAAFNKKIWIQNSVLGWIPELDQMLAKYYGI